MVIVLGTVLSYIAEFGPTNPKHMTKDDVQCYPSGEGGGIIVINPGLFYDIPAEIYQWCGFMPDIIKGTTDRDMPRSET
jgi:hypothetical protein